MPVSRKEFLEIQATIECGLSLERIHDMIKTHSQIHRIDKYSQNSSIICPFGFESNCSSSVVGSSSKLKAYGFSGEALKFM